MRGQIGTSLAALAIATPANLPCWADGIEASQPRFEMYAGGFYDGGTSSLNSSLVWSVFGPVNEPGLRLKLDGIGYISGATDAPVFSPDFVPDRLRILTDLMIGYQFKYGPAWIKLYAGAAYEPQTNFEMRLKYTNNSPGGPVSEVVSEITQEKPLGAALAFQSYWTLSDHVWANLNVTWLQPEGSISIYGRSAYEIYRSEGGLKFAVGAEANFSLIEEAGASNCMTHRFCENYYQGGGVLNLGYGASDFSLSGGLSQTRGKSVAMGHPYAMTRPYMSISYGRQF